MICGAILIFVFIIRGATGYFLFGHAHRDLPGILRFPSWEGGVLVIQYLSICKQSAIMMAPGFDCQPWFSIGLVILLFGPVLFLITTFKYVRLNLEQDHLRYVLHKWPNMGLLRISWSIQNGMHRKDSSDAVDENRTAVEDASIQVKAIEAKSAEGSRACVNAITSCATCVLAICSATFGRTLATIRCLMLMSKSGDWEHDPSHPASRWLFLILEYRGQHWIFALWALVKRLSFGLVLTLTDGPINAALSIVIQTIDTFLLLWAQPKNELGSDLAESVTSVCNLILVVILALPIAVEGIFDQEKELQELQGRYAFWVSLFSISFAAAMVALAKLHSVGTFLFFLYDNFADVVSIIGSNLSRTCSRKSSGTPRKLQAKYRQVVKLEEMTVRLQLNLHQDFTEVNEKHRHQPRTHAEAMVMKAFQSANLYEARTTQLQLAIGLVANVSYEKVDPKIGIGRMSYDKGAQHTQDGNDIKFDSSHQGMVTGSGFGDSAWSTGFKDALYSNPPLKGAPIDHDLSIQDTPLVPNNQAGSCDAEEGRDRLHYTINELDLMQDEDEDDQAGEVDKIHEMRLPVHDTTDIDCLIHMGSSKEALHAVQRLSGKNIKNSLKEYGIDRHVQVIVSATSHRDFPTKPLERYMQLHPLPMSWCACILQAACRSLLMRNGDTAVSTNSPAAMVGAEDSKKQEEACNTNMNQPFVASAATLPLSHMHMPEGTSEGEVDLHTKISSSGPEHVDGSKGRLNLVVV